MIYPKCHSLIKMERFLVKDNGKTYKIFDKGFYIQIVGLSTTKTFAFFSFINESKDYIHIDNSFTFKQIEIEELSNSEKILLKMFLVREFGVKGLLKWKLKQLIENV